MSETLHILKRGSIRATVTDQPIDLAETIGQPLPQGHGACDLFMGMVRDHNDGKPVEAVTYDAYVPLAEKTLCEIAQEVQEKWGPELQILVVHRTGRLRVGEASVAIRVSAPHREEAFAGCRYVIEEIKTRVPVWKKEHYADGETDWLRGHALCSHHRPERVRGCEGEHEGHRA